MKTRKIFSMAAAIVVAVMLFTTCGDESWVVKERPSFGLVSLTVQPVSFAGELPVDKPGVEPLEVEIIPEPIIEANWNDPSYNLAEGDSEELWFLLEEDTETARIIATATEGTVISWAVGTTGDDRPPVFKRPGAPLEFGNDNVIYIRVAMQKYTGDVQYCNYYRIHARLASPVTLMSLISVADRETKTPYDAGGSTWETAKNMDRHDPNAGKDGAMTPAEKRGELDISITLKEGQLGSDIIATKNDDNSSVSYAIIRGDYTTYNESQLQFTNFEGDKTITVWDPSVGTAGEYVDYAGVNMAFQDQDWLIAKVTAQNLHDVNYYKFRVSVGHIAAIKKLTLTSIESEEDGPATESEVTGVGVPNTAWDKVILGNYATANRNPEFSVAVELEDEDGGFEFVRINAGGGGASPPTFTDPATITFDNKQGLAIKVKSATGLATTPAVTMYYKVQVDLLTAVIIEQPKSAVYNVVSHTLQPANVPNAAYDGRILINAAGTVTLKEGTVAPLEAVLNRTLDPATTTYQWYTANSWYGGYGFDKDGRILGDPGFIYDDYHPKTARGPGEGGYDEKNNVSFHNGGNEFYRLPIGSYPDSLKVGDGLNFKAIHDALLIPGADGPTYTPVIDASKRPFIAGQSNQTQYYWVVIKDAEGRSVTSERAAILTEWGTKWDLGKDTGEKVDKMHHIVNLNAYKEGGPGLQESPRNVVPFTFHREKRIIPITFPAGFNIMNYSVATIQAKFYLGDGTVWIQNWTQGDVGFERNGVGLVLFYNLTNNNAAVGLAGDSKEPQGASITETPTHVVIKPAGEKPPKDKPPFQDDAKTPKANNDAQGWFTPYIEICELRFEGPKR